MIYQTVVITGASSGFGEAFARELAPQCAHMLLVARREEKLQALANELAQAHSVQIEVIACDLADSAARARLTKKLAAITTDSLLLINNAGLGDYGEFQSASAETNHRMMAVNMAAPVELTHALLPAMASMKTAHIINIASLAADLAIPDFAMYAASKAFLASFSEALRLELQKTGIYVTAVCPGPVHTGFGDAARRAGNLKKEAPFRKWFYTSIPCVVQGTLQAVRRNKPRYYPSFKIRLAALLIRNTPLWVLRLIMSRRPRKAAPAN